jgi:hypothetical protein
VTFVAITLCVASQLVIPKVSVYLVIDSVRKFLDTPSYLGKTVRKPNNIDEEIKPTINSWNACSQSVLNILFHYILSLSQTNRQTGCYALL